MKILYDCFSCSPYYGSDEGIGWLWPYHMRKYHEVWALVRSDRRPDIERYCNEHDIRDIHFVYADIPDQINFYYKNKKNGKNGILDFLAYQFLWQFPAYKVAAKLHRKEKFDLIHHVSTNDFRFLGRLHKLKAPYIIGPIGGAQETPKPLRYYVRNNKKKELLRTVLNHLFTSFPSYKKALNSAAWVYVSNQETELFLRPKMKNPNKCEILTEIGYSGDLPPKEAKQGHKKETVFLWAGRMEYRKGLEFLFDVLDILPIEKDWKVVLCGDGSLKEHYSEINEKKPYKNRVVFTGKVAYEEMKSLYSAADVFVFPSLRETTGTVIIEAMAHGLPVIALRQGGAQNIITEETGHLIAGQTRQEYILHFAQAMESCMVDSTKEIWDTDQIRQRVMDFYSWEAKVEKMNQVYHSVL